MNIFESIKTEAESRLDRIAVIEGEDRITYGQLITAVEQTAEAMRRKGIGRLHRVGFLCEDSIDYIITSLAVLSLSAVLVPVSPEQTPEEIETVVDRIDVDFLIAEPKLRTGGYRDVLVSPGLRKKQLIIVKRSIRERPKPEYFRLNPAFIRFTSGTTGISKGVVLSHEAIIERTDAADKGLCISSADVILWVLSMSYHFVVTILLFLRRGATLVLCGHLFPEPFIEGITSHKGTLIYASPVHYSLLSRTDQLAPETLSRIRLAISTTMKLPDAVAEDFTAKFGLELSEAYGIIEVGLPFVRLGGGKNKRGSVGKPLPDYQIALDNKDANGIGDIRIKGKGMLDAYYSPWQPREDILADGWFKTGDLGRIDPEGFLFIVGRQKDIINFAGMKIFAQEVEAVINQHPQVKESFVYGVPHPHYGQLPAADVVVKDIVRSDALVDDLKRFCYHHLAPYKVPKDFSLVDCLEKTPSGKIKRSR